MCAALRGYQGTPKNQEWCNDEFFATSIEKLENWGVSSKYVLEEKDKKRERPKYGIVLYCIVLFISSFNIVVVMVDVVVVGIPMLT